MEINEQVAPRAEEEQVRMTEAEEAPIVVEEAPCRAEEVAPMAVVEEGRRAEEEAPMAVEEKAHRAEEEEARRAKKEAEKRFIAKDYNGARSHALRAEMLCPSLEGIKEMKATFDVYVASETKFKGETDFYAVFGLKPSAIKARVIKQYTEMCRLLNPNCNKTIGADGAFNLLSEAWNILSDLNERTSYDISRNTRGDSFWTKCTTCEVHYEYLLKFLNKNLSCKNCRGVFKAINGKSPPDGSYPFRDCQHFPAPENGYANQRKSYSESTVQVVDRNLTIPREARPVGNVNKSTRSLLEPSKLCSPSKTKLCSPSKKKRPDDRGVEALTNNLSDMDMGASEPIMESRKILINIALSELRQKLLEIRKADAEVAALKKSLANLPQKAAAAAAGSSRGGGGAGTVGLQSVARRRTSVHMTVPDSDFHNNFDNDRSE